MVSIDPRHSGHRKRLRTRFLGKGGEHIPDYELLELLLFGAIPRGDVKPLSKDLLSKFKTLSGVFYAKGEDLSAVEGCGEAVVSLIRATRVAAERILKEEIVDRPIIQSWSSLLNYAQLAMGHEKIEQFRVMFLDHKNRLILDEVQQTGTVNHTPAYPREIVKRALELGASALILLHNHPSGDPTPSKADIDMTTQIAQAAAGVGITIHDHLIIAQKKHYSFKGNGLI